MTLRRQIHHKPGEALRMDNTILRSRFDVKDIEETMRYEVWADSISCVFDVNTERELRQSEAFTAVIDAYRFDNFMLANTTTVETDWWRTPFHVARDGMDHYMIQLFLRGGMRWQTGRGSGEVNTGDLIIFDMAEDMQSHTSDFNHISLILPRARLAPLLKNPDGQHMRCLRKGTPIADILSDYMQLLDRNLPSLNYNQLRPLLPSVLSMVAVCLNDADDPDQSMTLLRHWRMKHQIKNMIVTNLCDQSLTPTKICDELNVSRSNLYRLFEDEGGVKNFIRHRRLKHSLRLLMSDTKVMVADIASELGFNSPSDFSRVFRSHYGLSPREARRDIATSPHWEKDLKLDRKYETWLHGLAP